MTQSQRNGTVTIVHEHGSDTITDFIHLDEELNDNGETQIKIWYNEHSGGPDTVFDHASITSVSASDVSTSADGFDADDLGPCPHCDATELSVLEAEENIYQVNQDGDPVYIERGDSGGPRINVYCPDCHSYLYRSGFVDEPNSQ